MFIAAIAAVALVPGVASAQSAHEVRKDQREVRHDQRQVRQDVRRGDHREARRDRQETREDRRETRGDWRDYRNSHRNVYHRSAYAGPRGYRYHPVTVGYRFAPAYYGRNYWVSDWANYRLRAPGAYQRWIRYGNDVVLINTRTGRVLEVNNGFFW
jgi:Ni/Co efflux regulator RcnB